MSLDNEIVNADEEIGGITPIEQANPVAPAASALPEATEEVESNRPWSSDQSVSTLGEQTDDVILAHLPEYVGSNILNSTINGAIIEEAQRSAEELMDILTLDEDELAERDDLTSAIAMAAKDKAKSAKASRETSERIQEAAKADREEQRREEAQKQWDESMHNIGGQEFTGARLHALFEYLNDPQNADAFEQELMNSEGISKEEAKKRRMNLQEWQKLNEKKRNGQELTPEEISRERELAPQVAPDLKKLSQLVDLSGQQFELTTSAEKTGQTSQKSEVSTSARADQYEDQGGEEVQTKFTVPAKSDYSDVTVPLIKAAPLTPAFQKAEAAVVPLDSTIPKKPSAQMVVAMAAISAPQVENATF